MSTFIVASAVALSALVIAPVAWRIASLFREPDYSALPSHYPFKSEAARKRYLAYYEERANTWPTPFDTSLIETSYGSTLVRTCGLESAPPLVLLPSGFASSLIWLPNIRGLMPHFRIHAVDCIYDVGRSVNTRPVRNAEHLTQWLDELIGKIEPARPVNLMGLSFGGWLASQYALRYPQRLRGLVLAAPVATIFPLPGEWAWRGILGALPPQRFFMTRFVTNWMCRELSKKKDGDSRRALDNWMNDAAEAMRCFQFRMPVAPTVLTDDDLRSFEMPVLFVVGEHEVIYSAQQAIQRIQGVAPSMATAVIRDASHDLAISQTAHFNELVISRLLDGKSGASPRPDAQDRS